MGHTAMLGGKQASALSTSESQVLHFTAPNEWGFGDGNQWTDYSIGTSNTLL